MGRYLKPYQRAVKDFGTEFEALLWNSEQKQRTRFEEMVSALDLAGRSVADLGAGRADFLAFLMERQITPTRYVGVEGIAQLKAFCDERAREQGWSRASFIEGDFVSDELIFQRLVREQRIDTMVFSGSLNTFGDRLARQTLQRAWTALDRTPGGVLMFNFLSDRRRESATGPAKRLDTLGMIRWALERTPLVQVRHDYLGDHDCLIVMRRD